MIICLMVHLILRIKLTATSNFPDSDSYSYLMYRQITLSVFFGDVFSYNPLRFLFFSF